MVSRDDVLKAYGISHLCIGQVSVEGPSNASLVRFTAKSGQTAVLQIEDAEKLAAELLLVGDDSGFERIAAAVASARQH